MLRHNFGGSLKHEVEPNLKATFSLLKQILEVQRKKKIVGFSFSNITLM